MALYYFDLRDAGYLSVDEVGVERLPCSPSKSRPRVLCVDLAKDAVRTTAATVFEHRMVIEVRGKNGPVLQAKFSFAIERHKQ